MPAGFGVWIGAPPEQTSSVQGLPSSTGTQAAPPVPVLLAAALLEDEEAPPPPAPPVLVEEGEDDEDAAPPPPGPPALVLEEHPRARMPAIRTRSAAEGSGRPELGDMRATGRSRSFLR